MHHHLLRSVIVSVMIPLFAAGCIFSQSVDRAFIGYTRSPTYHNHRVAGYVLIPVAFAADIVTLPVQAVLLAIFGDNFPFEKEHYRAELDRDLRFQKLTVEQTSVARAELTNLLRSGGVSADQGLVLCGDGHWVAVNLDPEARAKLIARINAAAPGRLSLARAH